jgi:murein DD-endopeptidase MepM/ murein hydrolase activator NlpD
VVAFAFVAQVRTMIAAGLAVAGVLGANPALANSSNAADIAAPLRAVQEARQQPGIGQQGIGQGDEQFRQLFANWRSLDKGASLSSAATVSPARARVSIPSRMPVNNVALTSSYGMRVHPVLGGRRAHKGVDLAAPTGTPIYATADGVVRKAEWFSSYGLFVQLEHGASLETRYGHMSRLNVFDGQQVRKGDLIGYVGSTGRSTGPHLHYEVRIGGTAVNPIPYMQADEVLQLAVGTTVPGGQGGPE